MNFSNPTTRFFSILLGIVLMLGFAMQASRLSAESQEETVPSTDAPYYFSLEEVAHLPGMADVIANTPEGIRIKIVIIIIIRKKGVAEVRDIRLANSSDLRRNQILAEAEVRNGRFYVKPVEDNLGGQEIETLVVPERYQVGPRVSKELGLCVCDLAEMLGVYEDSLPWLRRGRMNYSVGEVGSFDIED